MGIFHAGTNGEAAPGSAFDGGAFDGGAFDDDAFPNETASAKGGPLTGVVDWFGERLGEERDRWFLWTPVGLGCGVAGYFALPVEPSGWVGGVAITVMAVLAWAVRRWPVGLIAMLALLAMAVGFTAAQTRTALVTGPMLSSSLVSVTITGRVESIEPLPDGARFTLYDVSIDRLARDATPERVRLRLPDRLLPTPPVDAVVRLRARLSPSSGPEIPGAFDFQRWAFFDGIGASGFALSTPELVAAPPSTGWWWRLMVTVERLREHIFDRCKAALPEPEASMTAALLNGEQTSITQAVMNDMRASGLAHLLSVSGLHVTLVAGLVFGVLRAALALIESLALRWPIKKIAAMGGIVAAIGYLLVVGPQVPMLRSVLMTGLVMIAILVDRNALSIRVIAVTGMGVLLVMPEGMLGPSFQMSFGAVLALISAYEVLAPRFAAWNAEVGWFGRAFLYFFGLVLSSVIATLATMPFSLFHFQQVALYGVLSNMLAVPVTSFWVMPWGVMAYALMPMGWEQPALIAMGWGVSVVIWVAHITAELPGASLLAPAMPVSGLVAVVLGGLWLMLWRGRWRCWGVAPVLVGLLSPAWSASPDVLVSSDGKLQAVRAADGSLSLSNITTARFIATLWSRRDGMKSVSAAWPQAGRSADGRLACDALGCLYRKDERVVALIHDSMALAEDCSVADAVISLEPAPRCPAPLVIDRLSLRRNGAHALYLSPGGVRVESVRDRRGQRPWTVY